MNDQNNMAQLRYLEELKIGLVHAGFEPERIEDQHLPVRWEGHYLCRVSGRGSVLYRQENVDGIGAQDALQSVIHIAAMTAEYMTAMERAPVLQATGLEGDYRILADFGDAVLAGHPSERGVRFVTWEWDWDREGVRHISTFGNRAKRHSAFSRPTHRGRSGSRYFCSSAVSSEKEGSRERVNGNISSILRCIAFCSGIFQR